MKSFLLVFLNEILNQNTWEKNYWKYFQYFLSLIRVKNDKIKLKKGIRKR
jgi:hypothetical protein